ncbi:MULTISPECIES: lactaldehyde reductase [Fusobacterium]|uniref:lactaldehyde reductase n=1 Tax=Fusobacterium TaxID=848 RepID=UPI001F2F70F6|nr:MULTISPECIES: lactaldehyde reductase [Fusobacterium]MCF2612117.1 lactaldehyde reductase [Fusobacterium perfoetens]MDY2980649.1 lactaldehyde reductase [Fusobacterium sp.]
MARYILNETSYFGIGCRAELATEVKARGYKKALLVSDKILETCGVLDKVKEVLEGANIPYEVFTDLKQNPTIKNCKDGLEAFNKAGADFIVAVGGGSVIDTAKAVAIVKNNLEFADIKSLEGVAPTHTKCVPIIALPTTCGTAAEVTINYVITIEEENRKIVCVDPKDIPLVAIVDAELMLTMPNRTIAATGMDALTHAIEGYITKGAHVISDMFEIKAIEMIGKHLRGAVADKNLTDMEGMSIAQYVAGMGFSNVGLGIVHSMAHPLGAVYDIPHGVANALLLPTVMEFNKSACVEKYGDIARALGVDTTGMTKDEAAQAAVDAVRKLSIDVGIPQTLREINIPEEGIAKLSKDALADVCTGGNPKDVTLEDIEKLYRIVY